MVAAARAGSTEVFLNWTIRESRAGSPEVPLHFAKEMLMALKGGVLSLAGRACDPVDLASIYMTFVPWSPFLVHFTGSCMCCAPAT